MTESSRFWTTDGTGDGPTGGYTAEQMYALLRKVFVTDQAASQGVLKGVDNELALSGAASPLSLASGAAIAYGLFYENTSPLALPVTSPVVGTTGGRVNLKVDWTAQTVRADVSMSPDGTAAIPALTQTPGSVWELPLYTFTITIAGTITLTDARTFARYASQITNEMIRDSAGLSVIGRSVNSTGDVADIVAAADYQVLRRSGATLGFGPVETGGIKDDAVTQDKIADDAVGTDQIEDDAVTQDKIADDAVGTDQLADNAVVTGKILNGAVTEDKIANDAVTTGKIANGAVTSPKLADAAVTYSKVGAGVVRLYWRQGGSPTEWGAGGTNGYDLKNTHCRIQVGALDVTFVAADNVTGTITFPVAFKYTSVIKLQIISTQTKGYFPHLTHNASDHFDFYIKSSAAGSETVTLLWMAFGEPV